MHPDTAGGQMIPQDLLGAGQQHGNHPGRRSGGLLPACIWAGSSPPLAVSAGPGLGFSSWSKVGAWVPAAGGQPGGVLSLQTDAGSGSAGKRLPPIGYAAQLQLPEKLGRPSLGLQGQSQIGTSLALS